MPKLKWDEISKRLYETGTSKGVLYPQNPTTGVYEKGVAWNGLVSVKQAPDGAEEQPIYADNIKYLSMFSAENFKGTIDAFTYPEEFEACDGSAEIVADSGVYASQQERRAFGFVYSTVLGNDTQGDAYGEKIHIIYNAKVSPSARDYETVNETPNAMTFSWGFVTTPIAVDDVPLLKRPTSHITIDTTKVAPAKLTAIRDKLYGTAEAEPTLPTLADLMTILNAAG